MAYLPIEHYGIVGDLHTVALVGLNGSIDWLCFPHFDSPSVFGAILDDRIGGRFQIAPAREGVTHRQLYFPDTNVLLTRFLTPDGVGELTDFMPVEPPGSGEGSHQLIRRVRSPSTASCAWASPRKPTASWSRCGPGSASSTPTARSRPCTPSKGARSRTSRAP